jgi:hypothetical protein
MDRVEAWKLERIWIDHENMAESSRKRSYMVARGVSLVGMVMP